MKPIEGDVTGIRAYRALLGLAFEHKIYFLLAVIGMIIFAASDAAFAYLMKPLMDKGFIDHDPVIVKLIQAQTKLRDRSEALAARAAAKEKKEREREIRQQEKTRERQLAKLEADAKAGADASATFYRIKELAGGQPIATASCSMPVDRERAPRMTESWFC